jgi:hypothetical protein
MTNFLRLIIVFICIFPQILFAQDGLELLTACQEFVLPSARQSHESPSDHYYNSGECDGYINGVNEMHNFMAFKAANVKDLKDPEYDSKVRTHYLYCLPEKTKNLQAAKVVIRYLQENPDKLKFAPSLLILGAFEKYFPCH